MECIAAAGWARPAGRRGQPGGPSTSAPVGPLAEGRSAGVGRRRVGLRFEGMNQVLELDAAERERSLANLKLERDAIVLYERLAGIERDPVRAHAFRSIAANERRHAEVWAARLREAGVRQPEASAPRWRVRFVLLMARLLGTHSVSGLVKAMEGDEEALYEAEDGPEMAAIAADEREHAAIWKRLDAGMPGVEPVPAPPAGDGRAAAARRATTRDHDERWHRAGQTGTLRAAVFGVNDGLVSSLALVMGIAGASQDNRIIVLAGVAGLLAGAFSMAAGEYISMQSQRELVQRQIELEREELRIMPEIEQQELATIFRAKGLSQAEAELVAARLMEDPERALDTKVREELGLDPAQLGSPWGAGGYSFITFGVGAFVPLVPFLVTTGLPAVIASVVLSLGALFAVGALVSIITGRSTLFSGLRQAAIGGAAALVTYTAGSLLGVQLG